MPHRKTPPIIAASATPRERIAAASVCGAFVRAAPALRRSHEGIAADADTLDAAAMLAAAALEWLTELTLDPYHAGYIAHLSDGVEALLSLLRGRLATVDGDAAIGAALTAVAVGLVEGIASTVLTDPSGGAPVRTVEDAARALALHAAADAAAGGTSVAVYAPGDPDAPGADHGLIP